MPALGFLTGPSPFAPAPSSARAGRLAHRCHNWTEHFSLQGDPSEAAALHLLDPRFPAAPTHLPAARAPLQMRLRSDALAPCGELCPELQTERLCPLPIPMLKPIAQ